MDRAMRGRDGPYVEKLNRDAKARYLVKTTQLDGFDPYEHKVWEIVTLPEEFGLLPPLTDFSIYQYLVCGMNYCTLDDFNNRKSMECHSRFTVGFVGNLHMYPVNDRYTVVRAEVLHSQKDLSRQKDKLNPWVSITCSGQVGSAHCDCMAGLGESCSHVAALLFKTSYLVNLNNNRTCTDIPAYWKVPGNAEVAGGASHKFNFASSFELKRRLDKLQVPERRTRPGTGHVSEPLPEHKLHSFFAFLESTEAAAMGTTMGYYKTYHDTITTVQLPRPLQVIRDKSMDGCELSVLLQHCEGLKDVAAVTETEASAVESETRKQHRSTAWFAQRLGRITASRMHDVMSTSLSSPAITTVKAICTPAEAILSKNIRNENMPPPMKYGIENEENARQAYITKTRPFHTDFTVQPCGFVINPAFPEVGASPDGLISCSCCLGGCLEVKCTFVHRETTVRQACGPGFCLDLSDDGTYTLNRDHRYYKQVQTQIFVTGSAFCDFVMWTPHECAIVRVEPDEAYWEKILGSAQAFFHKVCLPELVACYFTAQAKNKKASLVLTALQPSCPTMPNRQARGKGAPKNISTANNSAQVDRQDMSVDSDTTATVSARTTRGGRTVKPPSRFVD